MVQTTFGEKEKISIFIFVMVIIFVMLGSGFSTIANAEENLGVGVSIDGNAVTFQSGYGSPFVDENSRTLVPLRSVMESFGATVSWDDATHTASVIKGGITVEVPVGEKSIYVNGVMVANDTAAVIREGRTYLPIRAVLEAFGASVSWNDTNRMVVVASNSDTSNQGTSRGSVSRNGELKAMWISYLEYMEMPKSEIGFKNAIDEMMDECVDLGMNAVIVHVRSHGDAMYPSAYFPWSIFASGTQGVNPGYDPLAYMIQAAHNRGLEFHAWLNPYRVTGYGCYWSQVSDASQMKQWLADTSTANDRWILLHKGEYYLNPAVPEVRTLVANGVKEIVSNYEVDGIHFDDYFYPSVNDSDESLWFDKPEYDSSGTSMSIADWRRNNVNLLIQQVYATIKSIDNNVEFGISPAGNVDNLRRNDATFADIDTWLSQEGYLDYIMPQLYWGFERKDAAGNVAAYAYENNLKTWVNLVAQGDVKLYIGLNMANAGSNVYDYNETSEWLRYNDIIARQVLAGRATGKVSGYGFFRYDVFHWSCAKDEVNHLKDIL